MIKFSSLLSFMLFTVTCCFAQQNHQQFDAVTLQPTIAYMKYDGENRRMARLLFENGKSFEGADAQILFNGKTAMSEYLRPKMGLMFSNYHCQVARFPKRHRQPLASV